MQATRPTTVRPPPPSTTTTYSTTTYSTTTFRPTYEQTTTRVAVSTYKPTLQPKNQFADVAVSTYRPAHNFFSNPRSSSGNGKVIKFLNIKKLNFLYPSDDEVLKLSQSGHFFNSKNKGRDDLDDEVVVSSTQAPIKQKVRGRHRGRSKYRNTNNANSVTRAPLKNLVTAASTQKALTEQQSRQSFTNTPIVVQPVSNNRFDYDNFRPSTNSTALQSSNNFRSVSSSAAPQTTALPQNPVRDETFFDVPKVNHKAQTTKLRTSEAQNFDFNSPSSTSKPQAPFDFQQFGAIPQRVIIPSKLSPEQRKALQASNNNNFQTSASSSASTTTTTENPQFTPQYNRQAPNQLRTNVEHRNSQKDFVSLPQKFNFKTQKYESVEPQNPTTQFYNPNYETKGTDQPKFNSEPTKSAPVKQTHKTYAPRQSSTAALDDNKPTTFNPQQYYQSEQSQYQNLSPRGFSLAAQKQQELSSKTTQPVIHPQITSRSESRNHKKFSTLVPKDQYNPTTFKPSNNFSKKPVDFGGPQKLEKIQNPNKYYSQFTQTQAPSTSTVNTTPQPQFTDYNTQFQHNNYQHQTTRISNFYSSTPSVRPLREGEEDDGLYRPELYEKDFFRNKAKTTKITSAPVRNTFNNNFYQSSTTTKSTPAPSSDQDESGEDEFLKTAHSQHIFASANELRIEKERERNLVKYNDYSTTITEKSSPRPFSKPTLATSTTKKPKKQVKDVSYDYQYYDTNAEQNDYSELEAIEDFGKTAKKSSSN